MLKIRNEQIAAFQPVADAEFVRRIAEFVRNNHARSVIRTPQGPTLISRLPEAQFEKMVEHAVTRAKSYGLTWESSITGFVILMFKVAPNFDQHPAINRALTDKQVSADERIKKLLEVTTSSDWWEAKDSYDASAWQVLSKGAAE
jgi:hypothetical protein